MFTIGREREKQHCLGYLGNKTNAAHIYAVIDAVHDYLERATTPDEVAASIREAFINGGDGVWQQAGSWLKKMSKEHPPIAQLWLEFSSHISRAVRFRAACFLDEMPSDEFAECFPRLLNDVNAKVRAKAADPRWQITANI